MNTTEQTAALHRALDAEEAAARLRRALVALADVEELAEDRPEDLALRAEVDGLISAGSATEVTAARARRQGVESEMHRDDVLAVHRERCGLAAKRSASAP